MDIKEGLIQLFINVLIKKTSGSGIKNKNICNKVLEGELHKPIIRNFSKRKAHLTFIDNTWGADLADMQLIIKFNDGFRFLLCVIDIYSKYAWVIPLKIKRDLQLLMFFKSFRQIKSQTK